MRRIVFFEYNYQNFFMDIISLPFIYNLRFLVAGDQSLTKKFIKENYKKYKCKTVLDLGCGTGDFAPLFNPKEYLGIDISGKYVEFAGRKYPHKFICADVTAYPFAKKHYDCTIFISTLHHLSDNQVKKIMSEAVRLTKKVIIIVDLNPETSPVKKFLIDNDRGRHVRTTKQKLGLLIPFGNILEIKHFSTRLASQTGIVLKPTR